MISTYNNYPNLNKTLEEIEVYSSKEISLRAKNTNEVVNLSFGEPQFGPPEYLLQNIEKEDLTIDNFLNAVKRYENAKGCSELRKAIALWYKRKYKLDIDSETEIMVTHGGVEAIALSILCTTEINDIISVTDPAYMLYSRALKALGRKASFFVRTPGTYEYKDAFVRLAFQDVLQQSKAIIINSPENPSGYVVDQSEWILIGKYATKKNLWIIHDEVYDTMDFGRKHIPCFSIDELRERSILINSCSKKFGIPGLRIGWMIANKKVIDLASKIHDYLYLGINILHERIATRLLSDDGIDIWLSDISLQLQGRVNKALLQLREEEGFNWLRTPLGGMFLFPNIKGLYDMMPKYYKKTDLSISNAVTDYLFKEKRIAVVPGSVYGIQSSDYIRLVLCTPNQDFELAINRLKNN